MLQVENPFTICNMIHRAATQLVRARLRDFPAVAVVGARQVGKTTLARTLGGHYFDLEQPGDRTRVDVRWDQLCGGHQLVVLDEAQVGDGEGGTRVLKRPRVERERCVGCGICESRCPVPREAAVRVYAKDDPRLVERRS